MIEEFEPVNIPTNKILTQMILQVILPKLHGIDKFRLEKWEHPKLLYVRWNRAYGHSGSLS